MAGPPAGDDKPAEKIGDFEPFDRAAIAGFETVRGAVKAGGPQGQNHR